MLLKCFSCSSYLINKETDWDIEKEVSYFKCGDCGKSGNVKDFSVIGKNLKLIEGKLTEVQSKPYYSLVSFIEGKWSIQFGSYDKSEVQEEAVELKRLFNIEKIKCRNKIVDTEDDQLSIDLLVEKLNSIGEIKC